MRKSPVCVLAAVLMAAGGCDGTTDPTGETYSLAAVNEQPLPAPYPDPFMTAGVLEVTEGSLTLHDDGSLVMALVMRCVEPQPHGSECEVHGDGRTITEGWYSRTDERVGLGDNDFQAFFSDRAVTIQIAFPPSMGWTAPQFALDFTR